MELYADSIRFCIICNNIYKIHDALKSRCNIFKFSSIPNDL